MRYLHALVCLLPMLAQQRPLLPPIATPADVEFRKAVIRSEGVRMSAEVYSPKSASGKLPCILMAHGWGGVAQALRREAIPLAQAGYFVTAFDYRGWGGSDSRVILTQPAPSSKEGGKFTAEVQEVREVVDPIDFAIDWLNALDWLAGEPQCDASRIGIWGSSLSGGLVVWVAGHDARVRAVHSQVGAMGGQFITQDEAQKKLTWDEATKRARGEIGYPAPGAVTVGALRGAPIRRKFAIYDPLQTLPNAAACAMQFVIAEKEELFDNRDHAIRAQSLHRGPKRLIRIDGITHYGIYYDAGARKRSLDLAIEWFDKYVKASH